MYVNSCKSHFQAEGKLTAGNPENHILTFQVKLINNAIKNETEKAKKEKGNNRKRKEKVK